MKKITLLLLFLSITGFSQTLDIRNFKITSPLNKSFTKGDRFDYQFEIKGDYTYATNGYRQIDLYLYYENVTENNLIGLIYWNREGDYELIFENYTLKKMWVATFYRWQGRTYNTNPGKKFILVAKYAGITKQYNYVIPDSNGKYHVIKYRGKTQQEAEASKCNNDAENSVGVNIDIDQALTKGKIYYIDRGTGIGHRYYEVTNTSNNPNSSAETNIGTSNIGSSFFANCSSELADIEITNLRIIRNGSTEIFNSNTNSTPTLSYNNSYEFRYTLKNSGGEAVDINLSKFFSYNSSFDQFNDYFIDDDEISSISPGGQATLKTYVTPGNGYIGSANVTNNQGYYFIFSVVYENSDNSLSEYENRVGFIYSTNTASKPPLKPYQVQTFDFSGNRVLSEEVNSKEEEEQVIQSLPKGNYIIKANNKTYKISKD